ncbi:acyl carrier protein [Mycobacterium shinjukuense]|nr:acyl carrier protein [Mycobacterium shinjukuense]MCV6983914.1 acyl carrier protein [Mycobacterium shinjukuense]
MAGPATASALRASRPDPAPHHRHRPSSTSKFLAELEELPHDEWPARLRRLLSEQVGLILRRTIDTDRPLTEYGLDSLGSLELRTHIEAETKIRITTSDITTVRGLADLLYDKLTSKPNIAAHS